MLSSCSTYRCRRRIGTKATLEAHHILGPYRLPDRYRHRQRGLPKTGKHAIDHADQFDQLLRCELMMPHVAANDAHDLMEITLRCRGLIGSYGETGRAQLYWLSRAVAIAVMRHRQELPQALSAETVF
jgi:hypothetical protein